MQKKEVTPVALVIHEDGTTDILDSYQDPEHDDGIDFETKLNFFLQYYGKLSYKQKIANNYYKVMCEIIEKYGVKN